MGYDLSKRLSFLKQQAAGIGSGEYRFGAVFIGGLIIIGLFAFALGQFSSDVSLPDNASAIQELESWQKTLEVDVAERVSWLRGFPFGSVLASHYFGFTKAVISSMYVEVTAQDLAEFDAGYTFFEFKSSFSRTIISASLRVGFLFVGFWPLWLLAMIGGSFYEKRWTRPKKTEDVLGICDPGTTPFYSGIHAPLDPNHKLSGTEYSVPSLACPQMERRATALNHKLCSILRQYKALNETNIELVQVILAYRNFPAFVEEEHSAERQTEQESSTDIGKSPDARNQEARTNFVSNEGGTIEERALELLPALLQAHLFHKRFNEANKKKLDEVPHLMRNVSAFQKILKQAGTQMPEVGQILLFALTPGRSESLTTLSPAVIASAYLAIEAGKSLVYKQVGKKYSIISKYPHLQSRAVIQSILHYHKEYDAETRLCIRQAIVSSRRHGDFGRAFMPMRMPIQSRALRDALEICWAEPQKRIDTAHLVELDAHIDELNHHWEVELADRLSKSRTVRQSVRGSSDRRQHEQWKGFTHKSVVLMPLPALLDVGLSGVHDSRCDRVSKLLRLTRTFQQSISISARLPGFRRQAIEAAAAEGKTSDIMAEIKQRENGERIFAQWLIMRRMLTRFNWLSTRVGDDPVPQDGVIQAIIINRKSETEVEPMPFDAVVPLRQRRYRMLFGEGWESAYFASSPHPNDIDVYVERKKFLDELEAKRAKAEAGELTTVDPEQDMVAIANSEGMLN